MPELPAVEHGRRLAESVSLNQIIENVRCPRDDIVFEGVSPARIRRALTGKRILAVHRKGKHIWFELDRPPHPLFHFGMTGGFHTPQSEALKFMPHPSPKETHWPPRFVKVHLTFASGDELVMTNKRRLGRIRLRHDPEHEIPLSLLGFDPLLDMPTPGKFVSLILSRKAVIKPLLMNQSFIAGIGNWIADEVLYQSKIKPTRRANSLSESESRRLHARIRHVIQTAVKADGKKERFPRTWLYHRRWDKGNHHRTIHGRSIKHITLAGRTTAWVPDVQH